MKIKLNGEELDIGLKSLKCLVDAKCYNPDVIVVEHNKQVVAKADWCKIILREGDVIEVISFVGGG